MRASGDLAGGDVPELPSGTVTFLFTDLEGSTRLWEQHRAAMRPALERHDAILRTAVAQHHGIVVKTTGDGLHGVFRSTRSALDAALAAQRLLGAEQWGVPGGLRVRMGLHTGDAIARDGDYYGPATNRAARVMAAAHGGQVVVSHATEEILRDALPDEVGLVDLGEHRLPDLARPERIFQIVADGLVREFPPLRALDAVPGNLPSQLTSFVGRAVEREAIADALLASRLVTVTGVGGVGKSRIAIQVALDIAPRFPDGAWLCELATAQDAEELAQVVAATLGVLARPATTLAESVIDALRMRELVLVFDNCEHLVDAVGRLAEGLLRDCPGVRILATSREALGIGGEQVWPLGALDLPRDATLGDAAASEAVQLFVERAQAVQPGFVLDESNAAAITEICRRLDGIPLAVELAAARVTIMSPLDIAARLDQRFQLLTGGRRSAAERHQTLRGAIEWSYELLEPRERTLFERLSVFPRSFDAEAAVTVAVQDGLEAWDVLDAGAGLVAKSMLTADEATGTTRYQMLETLQTFAREQLEATGDLHEMFRRHADHYTRFAEQADVGLAGPDEVQWRTRVHLEFANLRAAFIRSLLLGEDDDVRRALRIVAALAFEAVNDRGLGIGAWAEHLAPRVDLAPPAVRTAVLAAAAFSAQGRNDVDAMRELSEAALRDGVPADCPGAVWAFIARAAHQSMSGDFEAAIRVIEEAEAALAAAGNEPRGLSFLYSAAANFHNLLGDWAAARADAERALEAARRSKNPTATASAQFARAVGLAHDDPVGAARALDESIELGRVGTSGGLLGFALARRSVLRADAADFAGARRDAREAVKQGHERGDRPMLSSALECSVAVLHAMARDEAAATLAGALLAGVATGMPRTVTGGLVADLGVADALDEARVALGEDEYLAALGRGAELTLDEVVTYVFSVLDVAALATP
jgi:predicted ATPase/class 3 adenylate cyclase